MPADFSTADLLERLDYRDGKAETARERMTTAIDGLTAAMTIHNEGAVGRQSELLLALKARDAGGVEAVSKLAGIRVAERTWFQGAAQKVGAEMWPLFRVPLGLVLAYWGARWSGALPGPASAVSIVSTTSPADAPAPGALP